MTDIPKRITDDEYDKLSRRLWEMEQKYKTMERATLDAVSLDQVFDRQSEIMQRLSKIEDEILIKALEQPNRV